MTRRFLIATAAGLAAAVAMTVPVSGTRKTFVPDWTFNGSTLAGWHTLGAGAVDARRTANWSARPPAPDGGWLVLDKSLQDVQFGADFRCADGCKTGVLLRAEKTADGHEGHLRVAHRRRRRQRTRSRSTRAAKNCRATGRDRPAAWRDSRRRPPGARRGARRRGRARPAAGPGRRAAAARPGGRRTRAGPPDGHSASCRTRPRRSSPTTGTIWTSSSMRTCCVRIVNSTARLAAAARSSRTWDRSGRSRSTSAARARSGYRDASYKDLNLKRFPKEAAVAALPDAAADAVPVLVVAGGGRCEPRRQSTTSSSARSSSADRTSRRARVLSRRRRSIRRPSTRSVMGRLRGRLHGRRLAGLPQHERRPACTSTRRASRAAGTMYPNVISGRRARSAS